MRILHVLDHSLPLHSGYSFRTEAILDEQARRGWETIQVTSAKHLPPAPRDVEEVDGRAYLRTRQPAKMLQLLPVMDQIGVVRTLEKRLKQVILATNPDIVHAHSPALNGVAAYRACRESNVPLVYELRALWEDGAVDLGKTNEGSMRYRASYWLETRVLKRASAVTTICEGLRKDIVSRGIANGRVTIIPNGVNIDEFAVRTPQKEAIAYRLGTEDKNVIGFIGSFYRWEGLDLLLEAMPAIAAACPRIVALLIGGGPEEERLRQQVKDMRLQHHVAFTGRVPHEEIPAYYDLLDILVYPRRSMRLTELVTPLKPLEAMARGRLVLASDVGGQKELVNDRVTGRLFQADSVDALAATVIELFTQPESWGVMEHAARDFICKERTWEKSVARYEAVYEGLLSHKQVEMV